MSKGDQSKQNLYSVIGIGVGAFALGGIAFVSAPIAVPFIVATAGAVGLGTLSTTAVSAGFVAVSASVGVGVGYVTSILAIPVEEKISKGIDWINNGFFERRKVEEVSSAQSKKDKEHPVDHENKETTTKKTTTEKKDVATQTDTTRSDIIDLHFNDSISDLRFLNLLDKYREKAIKKILEGDGDFNSKKDKIKQILTDTNFQYDKGFKIFYQGDAKEGDRGKYFKDFNELKTKIIENIKRNNDFEAIDHASLDLVKNREGLFLTTDLVKRIVFFKNFTDSILDDPTSCSEDDKIKVLKMFIAQHSINGDKKFEETLKKQKEETTKISNSINIAEYKTGISDYVKNYINLVKERSSELFDSSQNILKVAFPFQSVSEKYEEDFSEIKATEATAAVAAAPTAPRSILRPAGNRDGAAVAAPADASSSRM